MWFLAYFNVLIALITLVYNGRNLYFCIAKSMFSQGFKTPLVVADAEMSHMFKFPVVNPRIFKVLVCDRL